MGQRTNSLRRKQRVSVERDHYFAFGMPQSGVERRGFAFIRLGEQPDAFVIGIAFANHFACLVHRSVINHDDFVVFIIRREQTIDRVSDHEVFVVGRHDYRHKGRVSLARMPPLPAPRPQPLRQRQGADEY